jgi:prepilin-type N-terminal cleavage/methylation domain-containing protein
MHRRSGFTLIELLVVIAILAVLAVVVVLTLNPAGLLQESRDSSRISDMATLNSAIGLSLADSPTESLGNTNTVYVSIPDPVATSTAGDQCQGLGLLALPSGYTYQCASPTYYRNTNGTGWIPINFSQDSFGTPLSELPVDPTNSSSSRLYYTYETNGSQFEVTVAMESAKYGFGGSNDVVSTDGGTNAYLHEKGTNLALEPIDYGSASGLVGYWPLNEGTGSIAYDWSGNNATGSWHGTATGTNGYYSAGKPEVWAGTFDGSTTYVGPITPLKGPTNTIGPLTIAAWINLTNCANYPMIVSFGPSLELRMFSNTCKPEIEASTDATSPTAISTSTWHYIVGVSSGGTVYTYVDGVFQASAAATANGISSFYIGTRAGALFFPGLIDDVRIYNQALTAVQIAAMYNGGK